MRNLFKVFVPVAAAAIALVSCQVEIENIQAPGEVTIRVHATADELNAGDPETKTYLGTANTILWGTGEYMKLAVTAGETTHFATSSEANANGEPEATFEFTVDDFEGTPSSFTYQGIYPASAAVASSNTNPASYKVNLLSTQNATASSYDPAAYIMVAKPETFTSIESDWKASYRRATALNKITLKNVPSGVSIKRVEITAPDGKYLAGARHFNLSAGTSGDIYNGGGRTEKVEVKFATPLAGGSNIDVWFTSWGVEVAAGETLTIVAYTTDKKSYTKTITVPSGKSILFQEGYLNTLGANMSGLSPVDVTELEDGNYVILAKNGDNYFAMKAETTSSDTRMASVDYTESTSSYAGDADLIWTVSKSGSSYTIENDGKYLGYSGSDNKAFWNAAGETWTETNYLIDITWDGTNSCYHATLNSASSRKLGRNASSDWFAFYTSDQQNNLIFVPATVDSRTAVTLSFANDAISKTTANYSEFTGQAATAAPNESAITSAINYTMTGDAIGSITSGSTVSLNGTTGTATVTASFAGDVTFRPATASYTITVSSSTGPQYELVSAANDVVAGDYIITWDNTYYLPSGSTSGTNPTVGTGITVASNRITNTVTSEMVWTFTGDNTNGFTISDGTNILHSTNAAQGISITTTSTRKWTASVNDTYGMLLHGDDGGSRYLSVYNSGSWRYYALGNSYSGTLRLYKLIDSREDAPISWSAATGTATMSASGISSTLPSLTNTSSLAVSYASSDETVATIANDGTVSIIGAGITSISATYDGSAANATYKTTTVSYTLTVTDNRTACATPTFSPAAGEVEAGSSVSISCSTEGATIHYTVDGTTPTTESAVYSSAITIDAAKTIKAIAVKANYKNSEVATAAYTVAAAASTIAQVLAGGAGTYTINNILVYTVVGNQVIVGDSTGKMVLYKSGHGLAVGDIISIPTATVAEYNGILQIQDGTFNKNSTGNAVDHGTATNLNDATVASNTLSTFSASGYHPATFVTLNGTQSSRNINGTNATLYLSAANTTYDGQAVTVTGYIYYYNSSYSNYNFQLVSIAQDETTPTISVSPSSLSWAADETDSKTLTVTLNGDAAAGDYTYNVTSGTASDWTISKNNGTLTVAPNAANTSTENAKSITIRIVHADDTDVYQDVTCTQAKASGGSGGGTVTVWDDDFSQFTSASTTALTSLTGSKTGFTSSYSGVSTVYPEESAIKFASSKKAGSITTPAFSALTSTSTVTVTIQAAGMNAKTGPLTFTVNNAGTASSSSATVSASGQANASGVTSWDTISFTITGATSATTLTISAVSSKQVFINSINIVTSN